MHISAMKYFVLLATLLIVAGPSYAEIYRWVDKAGQVHFSDQKPINESVEEIQIDDKISSYQDISYSNYKAEASKTTSKSKVVMFSASWCGYCKKAETYFRKNNIQYTNYDIEKNSKGKRLYKQLGARGVPVILVGTKRMNGFSESGFERLYR